MKTVYEIILKIWAVMGLVLMVICIINSATLFSYVLLGQLMVGFLMVLFSLFTILGRLKDNKQLKSISYLLALFPAIVPLFAIANYFYFNDETQHTE